MLQCGPVDAVCVVVLDVLELITHCSVATAYSAVVSFSGMISSGSCRFGLFLCFGPLVNHFLIVL